MKISELYNNLLESQFDDYFNNHQITYHVTPVKFDRGNKWGNGYDELYDAVHNYDDEIDGNNVEEYEILRRTLKAYEDGMGNVSNKQQNQIYVSSVPEAWKEIQQDELNITYKFGGIYGMVINHPVKESLVPSGMGQRLPEAIININDILIIVGPYKLKSEAEHALKSSLH